MNYHMETHNLVMWKIFRILYKIKNMYKILVKEKTKEGYVWKHTQTMEADTIKIKSNVISLIKDTKIIFVAPTRYTTIIKQ